MSRRLYGCTAADVTTLQSGRVVPFSGDHTVWYDRENGTRALDLTDVDGTGVQVVTSDAAGQVAFYAPPGYEGPLWLDPGDGRARVLVRPVDIMGQSAYEAAVEDGFEGTVQEWLESLHAAEPNITTSATAVAPGGSPSATLSGEYPDLHIDFKLVTGQTGATGPAIGALLTAKGDLAGRDSSGAVRVPVGADGQVLQADSTAAAGVAWKAGAWTAKTTNYAIASADSVVAVDTSSGEVTLTLPAAAGLTGKTLLIVKTGGAGLLTVTRSGSDTIIPSSGSRTSVQFPAATHGEMVVASSGTSWRVVSGTASDETVGRRKWEWSGALAGSGTAALTGWDLTRSDTGQRDMRTVTMENGWAVSGTDMRLRRIGNVVFFRGTPDAAAATSDTFYTLPSGFRPPSSAIFGTATVATTAGATRLLEIGSNGVCKIYSRSTTPHWFSITFDTNDAWPSSLPGPASGSIPTGV